MITTSFKVAHNINSRLVINYLMDLQWRDVDFLSSKHERNRTSNNSNSEATRTKRRKDQIDLDMLDINEIRRCEETLILSSALRILLKPCEKDKEYSTIQKKKR